MFRYGELSDLLDGSLVTPFSKTESGIRCLDADGNERFYSFDDFDFDKKPEDRVSVPEPVPEEPAEPAPEEPAEPEPSLEEPEVPEVPEVPGEEELKDDSVYDGTDIPRKDEDPVDDNGNTIETKRFLNSDEVNDILSAFGIKKDNSNIRIWRDII